MTAHKHAESMRLYAQDAAETDKPWERWEYYVNGYDWGWKSMSSDPSWSSACEYRRKPPKQRYIKIGDRLVPEPMRVAPADGTRYYFAMTDNGEPLSYTWVNGNYHSKRAFAYGACHLTREAAQEHLDALIALNNQPGVEG